MAEIKTEYIVIISNIETGRPGTTELSLRMDGTDISDEELLKLKEVQKKASQEMEKILKSQIPEQPETGK